MSIVSERLIRLMNESEMSYSDLAAKTGISKATLQRYVVGSTEKIPGERLWKIAWLFKTTPDYLMGYTDDPTPQFLAKNTFITDSPEERKLIKLWRNADERAQIDALNILSNHPEE